MKPHADLSGLDGAKRRTRFETLYAEHQAHVLRYALRRSDCAEDAADIVAETFLIAWRRLDDAPAKEARAWLYGVARRVLANHRRGARRRSQLADQLVGDLTHMARRDPAEAGQEEFAEIAAAFRTLPDGDREILALEAWELLDAGGIAVVLGCSRNAARIRLHRARGRLRAALGRSVQQHTATRQYTARRSADTIHAQDMVATTGDIS